MKRNGRAIAIPSIGIASDLSTHYSIFYYVILTGKFAHFGWLRCGFAHFLPLGY